MTRPAPYPADRLERAPEGDSSGWRGDFAFEYMEYFDEQIKILLDSHLQRDSVKSCTVQHVNAMGQPIGYPVPGWNARGRPPRTPLQGRLCQLEALDPDRHVADLHAGNCQAKDARDWTYLPYGPFDTIAAYRAWADQVASSNDPLFYTIVDRASGRAVGVASLMRIDPVNGVIEVGHIKYTPALQRKATATEAMYLLMRRVFHELGYRRYEWKCDALNASSRAAALRLGFMFEGIFRQAIVYKGRNRDTAWFSIIDREWPALKTAYERWLAADNSDDQGRQRHRLGDLIAEARAAASH